MDGNTWKVQRISAYYHDNLTAVPLNSICAFSAKDIWVNAGMPIHGDGTTWTLYHLWDMGILNPDDGSSISVWGTSSNDIYFGGRRGTLVHYDGQNWNKLVSGTTMDFRGIYGAIDQRTNKEQILAVTSYGDSAGREIRSIEGPNVRSISTYPLSPYYDFYSLWFSPDHHYYIAGAGIYEKKSLSDSVWMNRQFDLTRDEIIRIKGNDINDVFAVGAFGEVLHYNGITWKSYIHEGTGINGAYTSVAIKNNLVVIVGGEENKAIIQIGRR